MNDKYLWIIEDTIEAWIAGETYMVLPNTIFVSEASSGNIKESRGAFLRYEDGVLHIDGYPVDVGEYLDRFLLIIETVEDSKKLVITIHQGA